MARLRVGGSTDDVNSTEGEVAVINDSADRHINKLNLTAAMTKGKLGIWAYHGQEALKKWHGDPSKQHNYQKLKKHLKYYALADSLHLSTRSQLSQAEFDAAIEELSAVVPIPSEILLAALDRQLELLMPQANNSVEKSKELLDMLWPWSSSTDDQNELRPTRPWLYQVKVPYADLAADFAFNFIQSFFVKRLAEGAEGQKLVASLCQDMASRTQGLSTRSDVNDEQATTLCEITTMCDGLRTLVEPTRVLDEEHGDNALDNMIGLHTADKTKPILQCIGLTIVDVPFYWDTFVPLSKNKVKIVDLRPIYNECMVMFTSIEKTNEVGGVTTTVMSDILRRIPKMTLAWPEMLVKSLSGKVQ